jgi:hypothetical protein
MLRFWISNVGRELKGFSQDAQNRRTAMSRAITKTADTEHHVVEK